MVLIFSLYTPRICLYHFYKHTPGVNKVFGLNKGKYETLEAIPVWIKLCQNESNL